MEPQESLAIKVLPRPLYRALTHVFKQGLSDCALVGGTALAGFYAGHRRSDDLDLFVKSPEAHRAAVLAVESLQELKAEVKPTMKTRQYYRALCNLEEHHFTADIVLDAQLFAIGVFHTMPSNISVVDLHTLFAMKIATLVSRCGEKDLYDLTWLLQHFPETAVSECINLGRTIDQGVTAEALLLSISSTTLRESACGFAEDFGVGRSEVFSRIIRLQRDLIDTFEKAAGGESLDEAGMALKKLIQNLKQFKPAKK